MTPTGGEIGRGHLDRSTLDTIDQLGSYAHLAELLDRSADDVRTWWGRDNYRIRELAIRADLRPPLFHVPTAVEELRRRISG